MYNFLISACDRLYQFSRQKNIGKSVEFISDSDEMVWKFSEF